MRKQYFWYFITVFIMFFTSCSDTYLGRYLLWNTVDIDDYKNYARRNVQAGEKITPLIKVTNDENLFLEKFPSITYRTESGNATKSLREILESNNTLAFIVLKNNTILYEKYYGDYTSESNLPSFSAAKSLISALVGIAIDEGLIGSVNDRVLTYLPELEGKGVDTLTIRHLLTMSSGFDFDLFDNTPYSATTKAYFHPHMRSNALQIKIDRPPGEIYNYDNYNTQLMGIILERVTGMSISQYMESKIWKPMGAERDAFWNLDSEESGFETMAFGFNATLRDYARFALIYSDNSILSEEWIRESALTDWNVSESIDYYEGFEPENKHGNFFRDWEGYYSYFWWGYKEKGIPVDFFAYGMLDQFIYISPGNDVIILRFGDDSEDVLWWPEVIRYISQEL
jgi:CubicO group peptidase (beta-lactamase class C family)